MDSLFWGTAFPISQRAHNPVDDVLAAADRKQAERASRQAQHFAERIDRLTLICMSLWSLLREKTYLTEKDLLERVHKIDLADGKADGKASRQIAKCPQCGRTMSPRHARCLYCGAQGLKVSAFDAVR